MLTYKLSRYCLLALHAGMPILCTIVCTMVYMSGDSPFIARRVNRVPLCPDRLHPLVSGFDIYPMFQFRASITESGPVLNQYCVFGMDS